MSRFWRISVFLCLLRRNSCTSQNDQTCLKPISSLLHYFSVLYFNLLLYNLIPAFSGPAFPQHSTYAAAQIGIAHRTSRIECCFRNTVAMQISTAVMGKNSFHRSFCSFGAWSPAKHTAAEPITWMDGQTLVLESN